MWGLLWGLWGVPPRRQGPWCIDPLYFWQECSHARQARSIYWRSLVSPGADSCPQWLRWLTTPSLDGIQYVRSFLEISWKLHFRRPSAKTTSYFLLSYITWLSLWEFGFYSWTCYTNIWTSTSHEFCGPGYSLHSPRREFFHRLGKPNYNTLFTFRHIWRVCVLVLKKKMFWTTVRY